MKWGCGKGVMPSSPRVLTCIDFSGFYTKGARDSWLLNCFESKEDFFTVEKYFNWLKIFNVYIESRFDVNDELFINCNLSSAISNSSTLFVLTCPRYCSSLTFVKAVFSKVFNLPQDHRGLLGILVN